MRYRVTHDTVYRYAAAVDLSTNLLHLKLRSTPSQRVLHAQVTAEPGWTWLSEGLDHFGNPVAHAVIDTPHTELTFRVSAEVSVTAAAVPATTPPWETVAAALTGEGFPRMPEASEFIHPSSLASPLAEIDRYARPSFPPGRSILEAARDLTRRINRDFAYDPTATDVTTPLAEVMSARAGVCQDFAQLQIAALRGFGLAARYVSGYIRTHRTAGPALVGADATHAWLGVWCGEAAGWVDLDPTNDLIVSDEHVTTAWGRDYNDVSPIRGVILGGGAHTLEVGVTLQPIEEDP